MTLDRLLDRACQNHPEKTAILSRDQNLSYRQLNNQVNALANGLLALGLPRGGVVAMLLPKTPAAVVTFLAVIRAGGVIAPLNLRLKPDTLRVAFHHLNPFAIVADAMYQPLLAKHLIPHHPHCRIILTGNGTAGHVSPSPQAPLALDSLLSRESERSPSPNTGENDIAYLNYTSGTTGIPKGAITTHRNLIWNTRGAVEMLKMDSRDVHLCMFPIYAHPHEIFCRSLYLGGTAVLLDSMYPRTIARVIEQFQVTCVMAVPPFFRSLFPLGRSREFDFSSLRLAEAGGVYSPPEMCKEFEDIFQRRFLPVWGSTETTGIALATAPDGEYRHGSMGRSCPGYEVTIQGPGGREAAPEEAGEMVVSGPGVVQGYFNLPAETDATFHRGAWHTGDMVRKDEAGFFYFLGRRSGLMKVAGLKVYPSEVETVLQGHPQIEEAAVIALPDELRGEVPKAFVVPKPAVTLDLKEVRDFCRVQLADYKVPSQIEIRAALPKTETGKISHAELAQEALDALADDEAKSLERRVHAIDLKILELLNARVELVQRIMSYRERNDQPLYSTLQGNEIIARIIEENKGPIYDEAVEEIFRKIIALDLLIQP
ncbi:MAG: long-chain fatty acid--CoA ligase [Candidatus Zixiibacteriota bacterium]|nr:MAG: long-chain fatty acid--CoA ligase [candidate division Zixibacteria bacterium]